MTGSRSTLLIVDDEVLFARAVAAYLDDVELDVVRAGSLADALEIARERLVDVVLLDQRLPDGAGSDLCAPLLEANDLCKIIFVTAYPAFDNVVAALRGGAFDYLVKPCEPEALRLAVSRCLKTLALERSRLAHERERERSAEASVPYFGPGLAEVRKLAELAMRVDSPILITGETGCGKSMLARAIHFGSGRREGELVAVNCAALPESLIEAELFGYEKGTFTGSSGSRAGLFELADGGSVLLDEITELPFHLQAKLLHVLEDQTVRRLGGRSSRRVRFRLITASNVEPDRALADHLLREDLYHRLNVLPIRLPPLRERLDDLPDLIRRLLGTLGVEARGVRLAEGEVESLAHYDWPGNVRELRNVLERAFLVSEDGALRPSRFVALKPRQHPAAAVTAPAAAAGLSLAEAERRHVAAMLDRCDGNIARTARNLGISRTTLRRKLKAGS